MRAAIYNPYLDTLGGGERYTVSFAKVLVDLGYSVDISWDNQDILKKLEDRFGLDLKDAKVTKDIGRGDGYDLCFWLSDGSIPLLRARKNIIHFQHPFKNVSGKSLMNRMKLIRVDKVICNSNFTKGFIDREYGIDSLVIYPPVDVEKFHPRKKENVILYVGRFSQLEQSKNQHVLINAFKNFTKSGLNNWKLILAGGSGVGSGNYVKRLKKQSRDLNVEIVENPTFGNLVKLYAKSKIFWSAAGYGVDEKKEPKKVEHFGITVVEAMASGVVPIIFSSGGHKEIVTEGKNGYLWSTPGQLQKRTVELIKSPVVLKEISSNAIKRSDQFSFEKFKSNVESIL